MTIKQLIAEAHLEICYGEIHLGTANRWNEKTKEAYRTLVNLYYVPDSLTTRKLAINTDELSFTAKDSTGEFVIVYTVDLDC